MRSSVMGLIARELVEGLLLLIFAAICPVSAIAGTTAARVLGQPDFTHRTANTVDMESLSIGAGDSGVAVDTSVSPNRLYVSDSNNNRVLGYASVAALVSGAPADVVIGQPDFFSNSPNNGKGLNSTSSVSLASPRGVAVDSTGNVYVADRGNCRVVRFPNPFAIKASTGQDAGFSADVVIGQVGNFNSAMCGGSQFPSAATLSPLEGVAVDKFDNLYIADFGNNRVLEYDAPIDTGTYSADRVFGQFGSFTSKTANNGGRSRDSLSAPNEIAFDQNNNLYVIDAGNNRVLEYNTPLEVTNKAGSGDTSADQVWGQGGSFTTGNTNQGGISAASFSAPRKLALDSSGNLYVSDFSNNRVLEFDEGANPPVNLTANRVFGQSNFTANSCNQSAQTPPPNAGTLCFPSGVAVDNVGDVFIVDGANNRVLKYNTPFTTNTLADVALGQPDLIHATANFVDAGSLNLQRQIAIDKSANPNPDRLLVADLSNNRVLGWRNAEGFINGAPADLVIGQPDFHVAAGGASTLLSPSGVGVDTKGNVYVADTVNNRVLEYATPFAACGGIFPCIGGAPNRVLGQPDLNFHACASPPSSATLCQPTQVAADSFGNVYVADYGNHRVVEYHTPLISTTVLGSGDTTADLVFGQGATGLGTEFTTSDCNHPNLSVSANSLCNPISVATDLSNNLYISDGNNNRVLEYNEVVSATKAPANVTPNKVFGQLGSFTTKICSTPNGPSGDTLCSPAEVALDTLNNLYIADQFDSRALKFITPLTTDTTADVVWGQGGNLVANKCNLSGINPSAGTLCAPYGIAVDSIGGVYISDTQNNRVTTYDPPFPPPGIAVVPRSDGVLKLRPARVHFGLLAIGKHRSREVAIVNRGSVPVQIFNISVSGDFSFDSSCGSTLEPGDKCALTVTFAPIGGGHRGGTILISDDAGGDPHTFELFGRGRRQVAR